jgi:hypothetical protein
MRAQTTGVATGSRNPQQEKAPCSSTQLCHLFNSAAMRGKGFPVKTLRFQGYSDDTFGEIDVTHDDYDNCASGKPIEYLITSPSEPHVGLVVTGQHCPNGSDSWLIGVANYDPEYNDRAMPTWPVRFAAPTDPRYARAPSLLIDVPDDFVLRCLQRDGSED